MRTTLKLGALGAALLVLGGCVSMPTGPSVMVLPGSSKSFDQFRADDMECRQFAHYQVGGATTDSAAADSALKSAAIGTAIGAVAGAAIGGRGGAATGAGVGLLGGSMAGAGAAGTSQYALQRRYDNGYVQCMYAKGHKVPTAGRYEGSSGARPMSRYETPPPPPANAPAPSYGSSIPPPPAGTPPPPPPGAN